MGDLGAQGRERGVFVFRGLLFLVLHFGFCSELLNLLRLVIQGLFQGLDLALVALSELFDVLQLARELFHKVCLLFLQLFH